MASSAFAYSNGAKAWDATHEADQGPRHLLERGNLPDAYTEIKARLIAQQVQGDADQEGVDYIWDIPVTLAYEIVGYRHDRVQLKSGTEPKFTALVPVQ